MASLVVFFFFPADTGVEGLELVGKIKEKNCDRFQKKKVLPVSKKNLHAIYVKFVCFSLMFLESPKTKKQLSSVNLLALTVL
jgi:hypothetical protein